VRPIGLFPFLIVLRAHTLLLLACFTLLSLNADRLPFTPSPGPFAVFSQESGELLEVPPTFF